MGDIMTTRRGMLIIPVCTLAFAILGCGGDDDDDSPSGAGTASPEASDAASDTQAPPESAAEAPDAPAGMIDACSLLTSEEAAAAVGGAVDPPQSGLAGPFSECLWRIAGGTEVDSAVVVQALGGVSEEQFNQYVEENAPPELGEVTPVEGVGDVAVEQLALFVLDGDAMVVVTVLNGDPDGGQSKQLGLAQAAVGRLP
jgi:hypothetical protein